jgi:hypothetical protein
LLLLLMAVQSLSLLQPVQALPSVLQTAPLPQAVQVGPQCMLSMHGAHVPLLQ